MNYVYDGNASVPHYTDFNGDRGATFRDFDGSITGVPGSTVVKPGPFYITPSCQFQTNWNVAVCPYKYGKVYLI